MKNKEDLVDMLKKLEIDYKEYFHPPFNTVEDTLQFAENIGGLHCKNLLLRDTVGKVYMVIMPAIKTVDLKTLAEQLKSKRLSFFPKGYLENFIGIKPGCVTPFALINDTEKQIAVVLDQDVLNADEVSFHPLVNDETFTIKPKDLLRFIEHCGQKQERICL